MTTEQKPHTAPKRDPDLHGKASYLPDIHRLLPQAKDAEKGVLSSFLLAPVEIGSLCREKRISTGHFHIPAHAIIYEVLDELYDLNEPIDFITVTQVLTDRGTIQTCGGSAFITELFTFLPTAANAGYYIEVIEEKYTLREIIKVCTEYAARAYDEQEDVAELLNATQSAIMSLSPGKLESEQSFKTVIMEALQSIETGDNASADIHSGIHTLDEIVRMKRGNLIVVSGEAKGGKTTLAGTIAVHAAVEEKKRVVSFGLEMMNVETAKRFLATRSRVNVSKMGPDPDYIEFERVRAAAVALIEADIESVDNIFDWPGIAARARKLHIKRPIDLMMIDYLQLIEWASNKRNETEQEVISKITRAAKNLAGELGCVIIGLCQMNSDGTLRGSRAIGMHANAIIAVEKTKDGGREIRVVGQRNGESNKVAPAQWLPQFTRFENLDDEPAQQELIDDPHAKRRNNR